MIRAIFNCKVLKNFNFQVLKNFKFQISDTNTLKKMTSEGTLYSPI